MIGLIRSLRNRRAMARSGRIGRNSYVDPFAQVLGWKNIVVGNNTSIGEHCCINVNFRDGERLRIGNNCFIGRRNFFSTGDFIEIGDYCLTGPNCFFLGAGHVTDTPFTPYIVSGIESYGRQTIGANVWLTSAVTVLGGIGIGYGSIVAAQSVVRDTIPPLCMAAGNPARVLKVFDAERQIWRALSDMGDNPERALTRHAAAVPPEADYLADLRARFPEVLVPKIASGIAAGEI